MPKQQKPLGSRIKNVCFTVELASMPAPPPTTVSPTAQLAVPAILHSALYTSCAQASCAEVIEAHLLILRYRAHRFLADRRHGRDPDAFPLREHVLDLNSDLVQIVSAARQVQVVLRLTLSGQERKRAVLTHVHHGVLELLPREDIDAEDMRLRVPVLTSLRRRV